MLAERKEFLGVTTNNVAEYRGLIAGLEAAAELGAREVSVRMDSKLVVEQMSGRWKIKHEAMIPLAERARQLVAGFDRVTYAWIPRKENSHADRLANEAMDDAHLVDEVRTALSTQESSAAADSVPGGADSTGAEDKSAAGAGGVEYSATGTPAAGGPATASAGAAAPGWTGAVGRPTRLLLLRHGQTELSVQRRYSGRGIRR
ncbi:hypothetical protein Ntsu_55640 [Nocardia sp. IFM 10818]